eukprot:Gb_02460 [translate_table: standard]
MLLLIERAKKCLDFAATLYIIHLFLCLIYGGWPSSVTWWVVNGIGLAAMALLGEWLCIRRELRDIPIRSSRATIDVRWKLRLKSATRGYQSSLFYLPMLETILTADIGMRMLASFGSEVVAVTISGAETETRTGAITGNRIGGSRGSRDAKKRAG